MDSYPIRYEFRFDDGRVDEFVVQLDSQTLALRDPWPQPVPDWAKLERDRCEGCALSASQLYCPTAAHLAGVVQRFASTLSITEAEVRVVLPEREYRKRTAVQTSLASLIGVYMSVSGCPTLSTLRPMVRFHLPFASPLETTWRAASMYLLAQFFRSRAGLPVERELRGLAETYRRVEDVNRSFARRLRNAATMDANLNALVVLDIFAKTLPSSIDDGLEELRDLFGPWLSGS